MQNVHAFIYSEYRRVYCYMVITRLAPLSIGIRVIISGATLVCLLYQFECVLLAEVETFGNSANSVLDLRTDEYLDYLSVFEHMIGTTPDDDARLDRKLFYRFAREHERPVVEQNIVYRKRRTADTCQPRRRERIQKAVSLFFVAFLELIFGQAEFFRRLVDYFFVIVRYTEPLRQFLRDKVSAAAELTR